MRAVNVVINEGKIIFKRVGGHKHDGLRSSLIDTTKYSMFDFVPAQNTKDTRRSAFQQNNKNILKTLIVNTIEERVLNPQGIRIQANAITAREIVSGTITADELSSNIILVNNVIRSNNYNGTIAANGAITANGSAGWAITSAGFAEFANTSIRGTIIASNVQTPGIDINSDGSISSTNFNVTATGNVTAVNANITGNITATNLTATTSGTISTWTINSSGLRNTDGSVRTVNLYPAVGFNSDPVLDIKYGTSRCATTAGGIIIFDADPELLYTWLNAGGLYFRDGYVDAKYYLMSSTATSDSADYIVRDSTTGRMHIKSSNRDLKENISSISNSLTTIDKLSPQTFNWKMSEEDEQDEYKVLTKQTYKTMGFVLEDVLEVSPELVTWRKNKENGSLYPGYWKTDDFIALAIQGIKDLNKKVSDLELQILDLKRQK